MEQIIQANGDETALKAQIRESFGRVVYSAKTHEKCADLCMRRLSWIKMAQITLSALITGGLLAALLGAPKISYGATLASTVISTVLLVLSAYMKDVDPGQRAENHKKTAAELWYIRESYLSMLTDLCDGGLDLQAARDKRDELQERLVSIYATAPRTTAKAYGVASDGLKRLEELTFSDEEIDLFLPVKIRSTSARMTRDSALHQGSS